MSSVSGRSECSGSRVQEGPGFIERPECDCQFLRSQDPAIQGVLCCLGLWGYNFAMTVFTSPIARTVACIHVPEPRSRHSHHRFLTRCVLLPAYWYPSDWPVPASSLLMEVPSTQAAANPHNFRNQQLHLSTRGAGSAAVAFEATSGLETQSEHTLLAPKRS